MPIQTKTQCYHCGNLCLTESLKQDNKSFCWSGFLNVYSTISNEDLNNYYKLNLFPCAIQDKAIGKFEYLDNQEIAAKLIHYSDAQKTTITFYIPSIHCSSCIWLLAHLNTIAAAIQENRVDFLKNKFTFSLIRKKPPLKTLPNY